MKSFLNKCLVDLKKTCLINKYKSNLNNKSKEQLRTRKKTLSILIILMNLLPRVSEEFRLKEKKKNFSWTWKEIFMTLEETSLALLMAMEVLLKALKSKEIPKSLWMMVPMNS